MRTRNLKRRTETWWLLLLRDDKQRVWLEKRPTTGIWAGLYCPQVFMDEALLRAAAGAGASEAAFLPVVRHALTHRDLVLHPVLASVTEAQKDLLHAGQWLSGEQLAQVGLPAPVRSLLASLH